MDPAETATDIERARDLIVPLCVVLNQFGTRVGVGHEDGFLVFVIHPEQIEAHDDLAHLFALGEEAKRDTLRCQKPALRRARVDPRYNLRPQVLRTLSPPCPPRSAASTSSLTEPLNASETIAADVEALEEHNVDDGNAAHAGMEKDRDGEAPCQSAGSVTGTRPTAPDYSETEEEEEENEEQEEGEVAIENATNAAQPSRAQAASVDKEDTIMRIAAGGVVAMALLYDSTHVAVVGGGPTPMGPPDQIFLLTHGEVVNHIRIPSDAHVECGMAVTRHDQDDGASPLRHGQPSSSRMEQFITQIEMDNRVLFVCTTQKLFLFSDPISPSFAACRFVFPFFSNAPRASHVDVPSPSVNNDMESRYSFWARQAPTSPASLQLAKALAAAEINTVRNTDSEREPLDDDEPLVKALRRCAAQPLPSRPLQVDHKHGLLLVGCSAAVLYTPEFTDLVESSCLTATLEVDDTYSHAGNNTYLPNGQTKYEARQSDTMTSRSDGGGLSSVSGSDRILNSFCVLSYHAWASPSRRKTSPSKLNVRVLAARAGVTKSALDRLSLFVGPLTAFTASAVEGACRCFDATCASKQSTTSTTTTTTSWRPAKNRRRMQCDWRTVSETSKQHLDSQDAILIASSSVTGTRVQIWSVVLTTTSSTESAPPNECSCVYHILPCRDLRLGVQLPDWKSLKSSLAHHDTPSSAAAAADVATAPDATNNSSSRARGDGENTATATATAAAGSWFRSFLQTTVATAADVRASVTRAVSRGASDAHAPTSKDNESNNNAGTDSLGAPSVRAVEALEHFDEHDAHKRVYHLQFLDGANFLACVRDGTLHVFAVGEAQDDISEFKPERIGGGVAAAASTTLYRTGIASSQSAPLSAHQLRITTNQHSAMAKMWSGVKGFVPCALAEYCDQGWAACTSTLLPSLPTTDAALPVQQQREQEQRQATARAARARWWPTWLSLVKQDTYATHTLLTRTATLPTSSSSVSSGKNNSDALISFPLVWGRAGRHLAACLVLWEQDMCVGYAQQVAARTQVVSRRRLRQQPVVPSANDTTENTTKTNDKGTADLARQNDTTWPMALSATPSLSWTTSANGPLVPVTTMRVEDGQIRKAPWLRGGVASKVVLSAVNCDGQCLTVRIYADTADVVVSSSVAPER